LHVPTYVITAGGITPFPLSHGVGL